MGHPSEGVWVAESEEGAGGAKKEARRAEEREERITEAKERLEDFGVYTADIGNDVIATDITKMMNLIHQGKFPGEINRIMNEEWNNH